MKGASMFRKWIALGLLIAAPALVSAQTVQQDGSRLDPGRLGSGQAVLIGGSTSDTLMGIPRVNSNRSWSVTETAPAYTDFRDGSTAIIDDTTGVGMADSSAVINMGKYRLHALAIKVDPGAGAATPFARVAISVRFHLNSQSDSASIFPVTLRRPVVAAGTADSLTLWARLSIPPTSVAFSDREAVFVVQRDDLAASKWGMWGTIYFPVADQFGQPLWAPYISVRIRQLGGSGVMRSKVYALGTPQ